MTAQRQADIIVEKVSVPRPHEPDVTIVIPLSAAIALGWVLGETVGIGLGGLYGQLMEVGERTLGIAQGTLYQHEQHGLTEAEFAHKNGPDVQAAEKAAMALVEGAGYTPVELV